MQTILIQGAMLANEHRTFIADVFIEGEFIKTIAEAPLNISADQIIDGKGLLLMPGMIDDQVHFREPGLTHKGDLATESKAAVAGGITSFMEMPNTVPNTLTQALLEDKYELAKGKSLANYSFFMGASNDNLEEVLKTNPKTVCGIKIFMGSSTGNMLVDDRNTLEGIFSQSKLLIAVHCEDEHTIKASLEKAKAQFGEDVPVEWHPKIRNEAACYTSSSLAVALAKQFHTRLHVLHISTAKELALFDGDLPLAQKLITAEVCVHHLWFSEADYSRKGNFIKWNPAIKSSQDRDALLQGLQTNKLDVIATDHAPHTLEEKQRPYLQAPSGGPLVQHALVALLEMVRQGKLTLAEVVAKTSHNVAEIFKIDRRGYIREGYYADLVLVNLNDSWEVSNNNIHYKCQWSPFLGENFHAKITHTIVNGNLVYNQGVFNENNKGKRLEFNR